MDGFDENSDKTVVNFNQSSGQPVKPTPGRRNRGMAPQSMAPSGQPVYQSQPATFSDEWQQVVSREVTGVNPLVNAASPLINMGVRLRNQAQESNVDQLRDMLCQEIKNFEMKARQQNTEEKVVGAARYVLCTYLDETIALTPWGSQAQWSKRSLLSIFHGETWGGEKFFVLLERLRTDAHRNQDLLELMYILISLGFEGKFRVLDRGNVKLEELRDDLYRQLRMLKGDHERELSTQWRGIQDRRNVLIRFVPLWVVAVVGAVIVLGMYSGFAYFLNKETVALETGFKPLVKEGRVIPEEVEPEKPETNKAEAKPTEDQPAIAEDDIAPEE
ncbi:DotU family type IV/VI secretion system protein [Endozoicomonas sp. SM1973]|uniref:DotU family type IV/VI secretion system protein n=1 Tax=Spartinivicinus marinus TaxID=2994442 RepID=A0A853I8B7_9GAMM|nr:type IVB secretion system protein IcmH/DotU [Spartinivicinus marinus]MCX4027682.1 type IVB secretion system protein IcmH/DotU [Spartinivicinus marinus]NYZ69069.1 DotU family type IV/VI secretion system protein [Spartinivicinus marinus]